MNFFRSLFEMLDGTTLPNTSKVATQLVSRSIFSFLDKLM